MKPESQIDLAVTGRTTSNNDPAYEGESSEVAVLLGNLLDFYKADGYTYGIHTPVGIIAVNPKHKSIHIPQVDSAPEDDPYIGVFDQIINCLEKRYGYTYYNSLPEHIPCYFDSFYTMRQDLPPRIEAPITAICKHCEQPLYCISFVQDHSFTFTCPNEDCPHKEELTTIEVSRG